MTGISKSGVFITQLNNIPEQIADLNEKLSEVAKDKQYSKGFRDDKNVDLLRDLAFLSRI